MSIIDILDVIWIDDETISPPKPKMVVCVHPELGWYLRINSKSWLKPCIALSREPNHTFLKRDSYINCDILELDDFIIEETINRNGILGKIDQELCIEIKKGLLQARIRKEDREVIFELLEKLT